MSSRTIVKPRIRLRASRREVKRAEKKERKLTTIELARRRTEEEAEEYVAMMGWSDEDWQGWNSQWYEKHQERLLERVQKALERGEAMSVTVEA